MIKIPKKYTDIAKIEKMSVEEAVALYKKLEKIVGRNKDQAEKDYKKLLLGAVKQAKEEGLEDALNINLKFTVSVDIASSIFTYFTPQKQNVVVDFDYDYAEDKFFRQARAQSKDKIKEKNADIKKAVGRIKEIAKQHKVKYQDILAEIVNR